MNHRSTTEGFALAGEISQNRFEPIPVRIKESIQYKKVGSQHCAMQDFLVNTFCQIHFELCLLIVNDLNAKDTPFHSHLSGLFDLSQNAF